MRDVLLRVVTALTDQDTDRLVDELMALGIAGEHARRAPLKRDLQHLIRRYANQPLKDIAAATVFRELVDVARRHRLHLPTNLVLMVKVLAMAEGAALELDPDFPVLAFARPYVHRFWLQRAANRIALSVLTAALVVGTGLLVLVYPPQGAQWFVVATFARSVLLGLGVLWSIWKTGRF